MGYSKLQRKAAKAKKMNKLKDKLRLIGFGAAVIWRKDGYFEYQDDNAKCLGNFMAGVKEAFDLDSDSFVFGTGNFKYWDNLNRLATLIDSGVESKKALENEAATQ